jgi:TPR repeat protein
VADYLVCVKKAAVLGVIKAHKDLADLAMKAKNYKVAMAHYKVLASVGYDRESLDHLTTGYEDGHVTKKDLETALRGFEPARKEYRTAARCQLGNFGCFESSDGKLVLSELFC